MKAQPGPLGDMPGERPQHEDARLGPGAPEQSAQAASVEHGQRRRSAATPGRKRPRCASTYWSYPVRSRLVSGLACLALYALASRIQAAGSAPVCTHQKAGAAPVEIQISPPSWNSRFVMARHAACPLHAPECAACKSQGC